MALGPELPGLLYFAGVKFAGYTAMAYWLRSRYPRPTASPWKAGLVRTAIGLAVGVGIMALAGKLDLDAPSGAFYALLFPVRIAEWLLLLRLFYERPDWRWGRATGWAVLGYFWSCLLDVPAVASVFLLPGGAWIC